MREFAGLVYPPGYVPHDPAEAQPEKRAASGGRKAAAKKARVGDVAVPAATAPIPAAPLPAAPLPAAPIPTIEEIKRASIDGTLNKFTRAILKQFCVFNNLFPTENATTRRMT
ncbi:60S ribosomal protein L22-like [Paramacrobiotus metropolitanus]|uniref:60S ribosomal protein L22-like n=1 Tax=Paramacrobiotus metropolitanus TaxID=2943436 RepID=UPI002445A9F2|nr:60S ribosomal protein L22-like [Paramacrobiotus metropolitanus]